MTLNANWPPDVVEAMIRQLDAGATFAEVGSGYDITGEWVKKLTGYTGHPRNWHRKAKLAENLARVPELCRQGLTDKEMAVELKVLPRRVRKYRMTLGIHRPLGDPRKKRS